MATFVAKDYSLKLCFNQRKPFQQWSYSNPSYYSYLLQCVSFMRYNRQTFSYQRALCVQKGIGKRGGALKSCKQIKIYSLSSVKIQVFTQFQIKKCKGRCNIFLGLRFFKTTRIRNLHHVTYIDDHLVKYMMQNSKKGLLLFRLRVVLLKINFLRHLWREITLRRYPMPLQWIALNM